MKLIFATNNAHKLDEARAILPNFEIVSLKEIGCFADIPETSDTLQGNSLQKAEYLQQWAATHKEAIPSDIVGCFADDTGLEIKALGGAPGVYTARWSGEPTDSARNRQKALAELNGKTEREAQFRTVVTLIRWGNSQQVNKAEQAQIDVFEGIVRGRISTEERGDGGFGYDPVFIPEGYEKTFAELPAEIKNNISHRARAMQQLAAALE